MNDARDHDWPTFGQICGWLTAFRESSGLWGWERRVVILLDRLCTTRPAECVRPPGVARSRATRHKCTSHTGPSRARCSSPATTRRRACTADRSVEGCGWGFRACAPRQLQAKLSEAAWPTRSQAVSARGIEYVHRNRNIAYFQMRARRCSSDTCLSLGASYCAVFQTGQSGCL